jgi:predicted DCC family thiol-disulfide oxidoreductase YuxK
MAVTIYYDGDCPFCTNYVSYLRLKEAAGTPALVDVRQDDQARRALEAQGYDLDQGMVAEIGGVRYWGKDALNALALLTGRSGAFNRLSAALFSSPGIARLAYPLLRAGRNLTLDLMGRRPLGASDAGAEAKFALFSLFFGLFNVFHAITYSFRYGRFPPSIDMVLLFVGGMLLFLRPGSRRIFLGVIAISFASAWVQAPIESNHTLLRNFVLVGFAAVYAIHLLKGSGWSRTVVDFSAVAGSGLLVMYFFGIFHKINSGFLDPATSCAVTLWQRMPFPLDRLSFEWMDHVAIYSTFVVEGAILLSLLFARTRHLGIAAGIAFHLLLALSSYSMYLPFTTLSIALHVTFLSPAAALAVMGSPIMAAFQERLRQPVWRAIGAAWLAMVIAAAMVSNYSLATMLASLFVLPLCVAIVAYGAELGEGRDRIGVGPVGRVGAGVLGTLLFVACMLPYSGLKNGQSMNMFANLRVEGGVSNHLVFREPPRLFGYLDKVVEVTEASGSPTLARYAGSERGLVWYDLLRRLKAEPGAVVSYRMDGVEFADQSATTLAREIDRTLHSDAVNKFLTFRPVHIVMPPKCI